MCAQMQHSYEGKCHKHGHFGLSNHSADLTANNFESGPMPTPWKFLEGLQSSQVVNWVKTKPKLAGNQIPFGGTDLVLYCVGVYKKYYKHLYTVQNQIGSSGRNLISC